MWAPSTGLGYETPADPCLSAIPHRLGMLSPDSSLDFCPVSGLRFLPSAIFPLKALLLPSLHCSCHPQFLRTLGLGSPRTSVMGSPLPTSNYDEHAKLCVVGLAYSTDLRTSSKEEKEMSGVVPLEDHHKVIYISDGSEGLYNGPSSETNRLCPDPATWNCC